MTYDPQHQPTPGPHAADPRDLSVRAQQYLPPMGWYPDPAGSGDERYWDGTQWTHNLRPPQPQATALVPPPTHQVGQVGVAPAGMRMGSPAPGGAARPVMLSGWGRRFLGFLIDGFLVNVISQIVLLPVGSRLTDSSRPVLDAIQAGTLTTPQQMWDMMRATGYLHWALVSLGVQALVALVYFTLTARLMSATPGQALTGSRTVPSGRAGERPGWGQAFVRALVLVLEAWVFMGLGWVVGMIWPLVSRTRQGLHDVAARTQVIRR